MNIFLVIKKKIQTERNKINCTENFIKLDNTTDNGTIIRGKYTLPKILALAVNVSDVLVKVSEK